MSQTRGDYVEEERLSRIREERQRTLSEWADIGFRRLADGDRDTVRVIAEQVLLPAIEAHPSEVDTLENEAEATDDLAFDAWLVRRALRRRENTPSQGATPGVQGRKTTLHIDDADTEQLYRSLYATLVVEGTLDGDATTAVAANEYVHQVGERYYSPTSDGGKTDAELIDPDGDLKATLFTGGQGSGKSTARKTVAEDRVARGHKLVDLLDMLKAENATYDIPAQADWQRDAREEMGLDVGFGAEYQPPKGEVLAPLTPELAEQSLPYNTEDDEFVVKPFVIPASDLTYRQLVMVLPHVTKTQENHLQAAHQILTQRTGDWTLRDVAVTIREDTNASDAVADRIERALETAQDKAFIQDAQVDDDLVLDWDDIMADTDTITSFTMSPLAEKSDRLLLASYLLDSLFQARRRLITTYQLHDYPTLTVSMGEIHQIVPRQKSEQDAESTIQSYMIDTLSELIALVRHADMELLCDTQKFHRQLSAEVSGLFHRIFAFGGQKPDIKKVFSTRVGSEEGRRQGPKVARYDDGRCALVSGDGYSMPIQMAPPRSHHLDATRDGNGLGFRVRKLDREEMREAPWDASLPARLRFDDTPDSPVVRFWEAHIRESDNPDAMLIKDDVTDAYHKWADVHDESGRTHKELHSEITRHFDVEPSRTERHDDPDQVKKTCYKRRKCTW